MSIHARQILSLIAESIDIPPSSYEKALARAKDLETWSATSAVSAKYQPRIAVQGSFRLGTVNRPLNDDDEYDLDLGWLLVGAYDRRQYTQQDLKALIGGDLETYRVARQIETPLEEKNRCWRLRYLDDLSFHLDAVPCLSETVERKARMKALMLRHGSGDALAQMLADLTIAITDKTEPNYAKLTQDWPLSNPEGYARWFEFRMRQAGTLLEARAKAVGLRSIDELPAFRWKTPLQTAVQLLKRHRDVMFECNRDAQPISVIITTLAAMAYRGEVDPFEALIRILDDMEGFVNQKAPRIPNPVNPLEDFAHKWDSEEGKARQLEANFRRWVAQARADVRFIAQSGDPAAVVERMKRGFRVPLNREVVGKIIGVVATATPKRVEIVEPARPWGR